MNEIKVGKIIVINNDPYSVVKTDHHKMGRGGAVLKVKMKNLLSGNMLDRTFQGNDKAEEADTERKKANYMYKDERDAYFMDEISYEQFEIPLEQIGDDKIKFLKDGTNVDVFYFSGKPVGVELPIKVTLRVTMAPPGVKGNSAGAVTKQVELETGATINAPMFINEGDMIKINTDTGEYSERA